MMALLEAEHPGHFALHVVGEGPLGDRLHKSALALGLRHAVIFHGFQANPLPILSRLQALLFASAHEGLPMTALESLALGVPIVSPPLASLERIIKESGAGCVAASASPRDLADAVLSLELAPVRQESLRQSRLPTRYHIDQGLHAAVRLWQHLARRRDF
jgi:glycosyltransferase involved in cell wall biosynthesis